ncbi:MAG: Hsp20/alpha crystallin family protein [Mariniblastus sp.]
MNALSNGSRLNLLPMNSLSRDIGRWIDELTNDENKVGTAPASIWEDDTHFFLEFDLPGVSVEDVDVKVLENVLHVTANRPLKTDVTYVRQERRFGTIERQFGLPSRIDDAGIEAEMNCGVLKVTIPKAPESQVKKIEIKSS